MVCGKVPRREAHQCKLIGEFFPMTMMKLLIGILLLCLSRVLYLIRSTSTVRGPIGIENPWKRHSDEHTAWQQGFDGQPLDLTRKPHPAATSRGLFGDDEP